ncbi:MAG: hypothetical protein ACJ0GU_04685 [Gammaproteobacteria bacterium]
MKKIVFFCLLPFNLYVAESIKANDLELFQDINFFEDKKTIISISSTNFNKRLDLLNYAENFSETQLNSSSAEKVSLVHQYNSKLKIGFQYETSSFNLKRLSYPKNLTTDINSYLIFTSFPILDTKSKAYEVEIFLLEDKQKKLTIDCYQFTSEIIVGSCAEANLRFLDSQTYKETGERDYKPALETRGKSLAFGFNLRILQINSKKFKLNQSLGFRRTKVEASFQSDILDIKDSTVLDSKLEGVTIRSIISSFKQDIPQPTPWYENNFKYSLTTLYKISPKLLLSGRLSLMKISRSNYFNNPLKHDFTTNKVLNLGLQYFLTERIVLYSGLGLSNHYLLGTNPLSYNRKSNHLFKHPYGEIHFGLSFSI